MDIIRNLWIRRCRHPPPGSPFVRAADPPPAGRADTGDNDLDRTTVSLIGIDPVTAEPSTLPMSYLDGPHDVEAFILSPDGQPILVTKTDDNALLLVSEADGGPLPPIRVLSDIPGRMHTAQSDGTDLPLWTLLIVTGLVVVSTVVWWVRRRS